MRKRRPRRKMLPVPVTSMGDIAFLLIIFFMICSRFAKDPGVSIEEPTTIDVAELDDYPIIVLVDKEGGIYFQGEEIGSAEQIEEEVRRFLEDKPDDEKTRTVLFRCDRGVPKAVFEPVIEAIAKGGGRIAAVGDESPRE
ncbi:MAG: biopolymer transporter ExbD [Planctomycetales bacterium]